MANMNTYVLPNSVHDVVSQTLRLTGLCSKAIPGLVASFLVPARSSVPLLLEGHGPSLKVASWPTIFSSGTVLGLSAWFYWFWTVTWSSVIPPHSGVTRSEWGYVPFEE